MAKPMRAIPGRGETLRFLITSMGLRRGATIPQLLDEMANERKGADLLYLERKIITDLLVKPIREYCGGGWAKSFEGAVIGTLNDLRTMAVNFDVGILPPTTGREIVLNEYVFPMAATFLRDFHDEHDGPDLFEFIKKPFNTLYNWAESLSDGKEFKSINPLQILLGEVDDRTFSRWKEGLPIDKLSIQDLDYAQLQNGTCKYCHNVTAWFVLSTILQNISSEQRRKIANHIQQKNRTNYNILNRLETFIDKSMDEYLLTNIKFSEWDRQARSLANSFSKWRQERLSGFYNSEQLHKKCAMAEQTIAALKNNMTDASWVIIQKVKAWLAWDRGEPKKAMKFFQACVDALWWCGGPTQEEALEEAMIFAAGIGDKVACNNLWQKAKFLGFEHGSRKDLRDRDIRNLASSFMPIFGKPVENRNVKHQAMELLPMHGPCCDLEKLTRDELKAEGKPSARYWEHGRLTPLMAHVLWGKIDNVRRLIEVGHSVDIVVEETGLTALHCALWALRWFGAENALQMILEKRPSPATVDMPYGEWEEKPIWAAIGTCRPDIVLSLLKLGAKADENCDAHNRPLYAVLQHWHMRTKECQAMALGNCLNGNWPADNPLLRSMGIAFDSKAFEFVSHLLSTPRNFEIHNSLNRVMHPALTEEEKLGLRSIARALLDHGADPNHEAFTGVASKGLTPTLYAAEIGDLELFKILLDNGGNPHVSLNSCKDAIRKDALWIASSYGNTEIASFLTNKTG